MHASADPIQGLRCTRPGTQGNPALKPLSRPGLASAQAPAGLCLKLLRAASLDLPRVPVLHCSSETRFCSLYQNRISSSSRTMALHTVSPGVTLLSSPETACLALLHLVEWTIAEPSAHQPQQ